MKFMKLGSKPDTFQAEGKCIRYAVSDLATDITINIGEVKFYLHKFPLLSKSNRIQKLINEANEDSYDEINIPNLPGGSKAFEICSKFCYGITVTLNAYNVAAVRCAAEYLEMTEDVDRGNLIYKIEVFLDSGVLRNWKDSIILLQRSKSLVPCSEDLKIISRCIDSISEKTSADHGMITWSYSHNRRLSVSDEIVEKKIENVPEDWWVEDVCELEMDMFERVMKAVKSKGRVSHGIIGEALRYYVTRWLPESMEMLMLEASRNRHIVETVVCLLPRVNGIISYCSCNFLLKFLKVAILVGSDYSVREELIKNISMKLHEASVKDLRIHEVDLVHRMFDLFMVDQKRHSEEDDLSIGRLMDLYLADIARDPDLPLAIFMELSEKITKSGRPIHDGLYNAIDTFLKEHMDLSKSEKKKLCGLMDVRKLTPKASMDVAQNERLPLRVVVQVLYFEQLRSQSPGPEAPPCSDSRVYDRTEMMENRAGGGEETETRKKLSKNCRSSKSTRSGGAQLMPSRSRRIIEKLWPGKVERSNKSSEVSTRSSQSPTGKSSGSSSRQRRHSIS